MLKYYFIPITYESMLRQMEDDFLNREVTDTYTVITGVYKPAEILNEELTLVYNYDILKQTTFIKKGFKDMNNNIFGCIGFCLEADLEISAPEYQAIINQFTDILQFTSAEDYLQWLNT